LSRSVQLGRVEPPERPLAAHPRVHVHFDSWRAGGLPLLERRTGIFLAEFAARLWEGLWPVLILLAVVLAVGLASPSRLAATLRERARTLAAAAITLILCAGFFALVGFYRNRLAFNVVVPVVVVAGVILDGLLERMPRRPAAATLALVAVVAAGDVASALARVTWPY
jgi:hypothetical protein